MTHISELSRALLSPSVARGFDLFGDKVLEKPKRKHAEEVTMWRCPECGDLHDDEDEAEACCQGEEDKPEYACPICSRKAEDGLADALDCCLWHDFDYMARTRIGHRVEAGMLWSEAIQQELEAKQ